MIYVIGVFALFSRWFSSNRMAIWSKPISTVLSDEFRAVSGARKGSRQSSRRGVLESCLKKVLEGRFRVGSQRKLPESSVKLGGSGGMTFAH